MNVFKLILRELGHVALDRVFNKHILGCGRKNAWAKYAAIILSYA